MKNEYNKHQEDSRLSKISLNAAEELLKSFEESWIYIKSNIHFSEDGYALSDFTGQYYKFKIRIVSIDGNYIRIYGFEDNDRLFINKSLITQSESSEKNDEIKLTIEREGIFNDIFIKKYSPRLDSRIQDILQNNKNLIISEGKTDWKHLKNAFDRFKNSGRFFDLDIGFFEYEDEVQMGNRTLEKVCSYNSLFSNDYLKIFVYDADDTNINKNHAGKEYLFHGNNVYSMVLPLPEHRSSTPLISIEHYYTDDDIRTVDSKGRRLFLANEFDISSGEHNEIENTYCLKVNQQVESNLIIDEKVYRLASPVNHKEEIQKCEDKVSIALSKNDFAQNILQRISPFDKCSVECFSKFFEVITKIYEEYLTNKKDDAVEISQGVYHKYWENEFQDLTLECSISYNSAIRLKNEDRLAFEMYVDESKEHIVLKIYSIDGEYLLGFPIKISDALINYLLAKEENNYNHMYLHVYDENKKHISFKEILSSDVSCVIINKVLNELRAN